MPQGGAYGATGWSIWCHREREIDGAGWRIGATDRGIDGAGWSIGATDRGIDGAGWSIVPQIEG